MTAPIPDTIRELAAGYALGVLSAEEARQFEAAMAVSPELAREVADYREVGALLAMEQAAAQGAAPDPAVKERLMARVGRSKEASLPRRSEARRLSPALIAALAAAVVAAVGFGLQNRSLKGELARNGQALASRDSAYTAQEARLAELNRTVDAMLGAGSALSVVQLVKAGPDAPGLQLFWNRRANVAVLAAYQLPQAPNGRVYQLWLLRDGAPIPSQTFNTGADGRAIVQAFALPPGGRFEGAAVTEEPAGGSAAPTTPILLYSAISD